MGATSLKELAFKVYVVWTCSMYWFVNLTTLLRFLQVVVWKRVVEINEDLVTRAINMSVALICITLGGLCHGDYKQYIAMSIFSGEPVEAPLTACIDSKEPHHQKYPLGSVT